VIVLGIVIAITLFTGVAFAENYLGSGYFHTNQMYWCHFGSYPTENQNAAATWSYTTDLDIYSNCDNRNASTAAYDYGNTGWYGYAYICNVGGGCQNADLEYLYCIAESNTYYLSSWNSTERQFNATHELGHCWSLGHRVDSTSVMQGGRYSITSPNATDIQLVNNRY
jgi:hypothetical protein